MSLANIQANTIMLAYNPHSHKTVPTQHIIKNPDALYRDRLTYCKRKVDGMNVAATSLTNHKRWGDLCCKQCLKRMEEGRKVTS